VTANRHSRDGGNPGIQAPVSVPLDSRLREKNGIAAPDTSDAEFNAMTSRLLRREALRRAAEELNTTSGPGLESMLARISAEATAEAASRSATTTVPKPHP
jgi:phage shock protein A